MNSTTKGIAILTTQEINNFLKENDYKEFTRSELINYVVNRKNLSYSIINKIVSKGLLDDYVVREKKGKNPAVFFTKAPIPLKRVEICYQRHLDYIKKYWDNRGSSRKSPVNTPSYLLFLPRSLSPKGYFRILKWVLNG